MALKEALQQLNIDILYDEPMSNHTTYKVGGNARYFIEVDTIDHLSKIIELCKQHDTKYMVVGRGSDLLFSDKVYDGVIICLNKYFSNFEVEGNDVVVSAGMSSIVLAIKTGQLGLSGFEFASGIPGSIGGGIYMNAGAYKSDYSEILEYADIRVDGQVKRFTNEQMKFAYRTSILQSHKDWIVLSAKFNLVQKDADEILSQIASRKERRMASQPVDKPSAGSVFRNPENVASWQLVDECGLRGYRIGGAMVSPKHSNFIVNEDNATGQDVLDVINHVHDTVLEKTGVDLHKEVILVNWED